MNRKNDEELHSNKKSETNPYMVLLFKILSVLASKKFLIIFFSVIMTGIVVLSAYYELLSNKKYHISVLNFSLTFKGVNEGKYPNGTPFVEADIISTPVLWEAYRRCKLEKFYGDFNNFRSTISIQRYNPRITFLNQEYKAKLANTKLTSARRYEIEQEFYRQMSNYEAKPSFSIISSFPDETGNINIPEELISKALNSILECWLERAKKFYGVTLYNMEKLKGTLNKNLFGDVDYLNSADFMRILLKDLNDDIKELGNLPNSKLIEVKYKKQNWTLRDISIRIKYIKDNILIPLLDLIRESNVFKSKQRTIVYLEAQINELELRKNILSEKKDNYENLLLEHYISTPEPIVKLGEDIMVTENDLIFYKKFLAQIKYAEKQKSVKNEKEIIKLQDQLFNNVNSMIEVIDSFYRLISKYNLERDASFYHVKWFSSFTQSTLNSKVIIKKAATIWGILELVIIVIIVGFSLVQQEFINNHSNSGGFRFDGGNENEDGVLIREYVKLRSLPSRSETLERLKKIPEDSETVENRKTVPK